MTFRCPNCHLTYALPCQIPKENQKSCKYFLATKESSVFKKKLTQNTQNIEIRETQVQV